MDAGSVSAWVSSVLGQIPKNVPMDQVQQFLTTQVSPIPCSLDVSSRLIRDFQQWEGQVEATGLYLDGFFGAIIAEVSLDVLAAAASAEGVYIAATPYAVTNCIYLSNTLMTQQHLLMNVARNTA